MTKLWLERKTPIKENFEDDPLFTLLEKTRNNIFITGPAGSGKSTILKKFLSLTKKENYAVLAPTGVAAAIVEGQTIHSFFRLPLGIITDEEINQKRFGKLYRGIETIIIDEISMVRREVFDAMDKIMRKYKDSRRPFGGAQLILFGDMYQLPPVVTENEKPVLMKKYGDDLNFFFNSDAYKELDLVVVSLNEVYRQSDKAFIELLKRMRKNEVTGEDIIELNKCCNNNRDKYEYTVLSTINRRVEEYNQKRLDSLPGKTAVYEAEIREKGDIKFTPAAERLILKADLTNDIVEVKLDGETGSVLVDRNVWKIFRHKFENGKICKEKTGEVEQIPLKLAWAITVHKSQGQTLDKVLIDFSYRPWEHGQAYVAFSRIKSLNGLVLANPVKGNEILTSSNILEWEEEIRNKKDYENETALIDINGLNYAESKEVVEQVRKEITDFGLNDKLIEWKSQSSFEISKNSLLAQFILERIKFHLNCIRDNGMKDVYINKGRKDEILLRHRPSDKEFVQRLMQDY